MAEQWRHHEGSREMNVQTRSQRAIKSLAELVRERSNGRRPTVAQAARSCRRRKVARLAAGGGRISSARPIGEASTALLLL